MLQQIRDKISGWFAIVFLSAIAVVFVFWGIRFESSVEKAAATVNGESIPLPVVRKAWQERQTQLQVQLRGELPEALVKSEQGKLIDAYIGRELIVQRAHGIGYRVSDAELAETIYGIPELQVEGKFSRDRYAALLREQGRTEAQFETEFRRDLETGQLRGGIALSTFITPGELRRRVELEGETRDVEYAVIPAATYLPTVTVTPEQVAAWYKAHQAEFKTAETVSLQYLMLNIADVAAAVQVTDEGLHKYYDQIAPERFVDAERRRSSHILVEAGSDDAAALKKAEQLAVRAKGGEDFARLAQQNSDDPGSKQAGGDLGWATREAFVQPFSEALFGMHKGEIRGPVKTQFGYHIIRLDDIQAPKQRSFDEVRAELEADYRKEQAQNSFYEKSQQLADDAFSALSELDSVGKKLGLPVQTVDAYTRQGGGVFGADRKVIDAVFSDDVLEQRQNSPAVSLGDDRVVVVRVTDHKLPQQRPLAEVQAQVDATLRQQGARAAAEAAARAAAARIGAGEALAAVVGPSVQPVPKQSLGRAPSDTVPAAIVKAAFLAARPAAGQQVARTAVLPNGDAAVLAVSAVRSGTVAATPDQQAAQLSQIIQRGGQQAALAEYSAYTGDLQRSAKIKRNPAVFAE
jgi:peptidyl-prolyl cis-trans isomerase D